MVNGRVTHQEIYQMQSAVMKDITWCKVKIAEVKTKQEDMGEDIAELKKMSVAQAGLIGNYREKFGVVKGKLMVWGLIGGGGISLIVMILSYSFRSALFGG